MALVCEKVGLVHVERDLSELEHSGVFGFAAVQALNKGEGSGRIAVLTVSALAGSVSIHNHAAAFG